MGSNPLAIPIFQMKQKIPFSAVDMQSKWDYLLHLERGTPTAHEIRSRAEAETVAGARLRTEAGTGTAAAYGAGSPAQSPITRSKIARTLKTHARHSSVRMLIYLCCSAKVIVPAPFEATLLTIRRDSHEPARKDVDAKARRSPKTG